MSKDDEIQIIEEDPGEFDLSFKLIVIGDSFVGKSCLSLKASKGVFNENYTPTIGFEFLTFFVKIGESIIKLQIWDTCGQEMYRSLVQGFYRNTSLALVVYDVHDKKTYDSLDIWIRDIIKNTEQDLPIFVAGNKTDWEREVSFEEANIFTLSNRVIYFTECSAKTGKNINEIFVEAAKHLYKTYKEYKTQNSLPSSGRLKIENDTNKVLDKKKKKCC